MERICRTHKTKINTEEEYLAHMSDECIIIEMGGESMETKALTPDELNTYPTMEDIQYPTTSPGYKFLKENKN
jgi:hypothetical protein